MKRFGLIGGLAALVALLFLGSLLAGKAWVPPSAWFGGDERWWIVALFGEVQWSADKCAALKREVIGECL